MAIFILRGSKAPPAQRGGTTFFRKSTTAASSDGTALWPMPRTCAQGQGTQRGCVRPAAPACLHPPALKLQDSRHQLQVTFSVLQCEFEPKPSPAHREELSGGSQLLQQLMGCGAKAVVDLCCRMYVIIVSMSCARCACVRGVGVQYCCPQLLEQLVGSGAKAIVDLCCVGIVLCVMSLGNVVRVCT